MKTPTLEEMVETAKDAWDNRYEGPGSQAMTDAVRAVIETHFVPMLAEAYRAAIGGSEMSHQYADRIKRLILESGK